MVREEEEVARNLTMRSNRAKEGRERKFDGRGGAPVVAMAASGLRARFRPRSGSIKLEKVWWSFGARLGRSGREGLKRSGKGVVGAASGDELRSCSGSA
jgi:hypothetical protein